MILIVFLLAPTVPSEPRPKKTARRWSARSNLRDSTSAQVRDIIDNADREMTFQF
jgi:hypothetical protein